MSVAGEAVRGGRAGDACGRGAMLAAILGDYNSARCKAHSLSQRFSYCNLCPLSQDLKVTVEAESKIGASESGLETHSNQDFLPQSHILS